MRNKLSPKHSVAVLSAVFLVIGGGVGAILVLAKVAASFYPELSEPGAFDGIWIPIGVAIMLLCLMVGMLFGSTVWLALMRFLLSRDELREYFTKPYVPLVTPLLSWLFSRLYSAER